MYAYVSKTYLTFVFFLTASPLKNVGIFSHKNFTNDFGKKKTKKHNILYNFDIFRGGGLEQRQQG